MGTEGIANEVRRARKALLLSQEQVADAAGVSVSTVARLERGGGVSDESLKAICAVVGLDAGALRHREEIDIRVGTAPEPEPPRAEGRSVPCTPRKRWAKRLAWGCLTALACLPLSLLGIDLGVQKAIRSSEADRIAILQLRGEISVLGLAQEINKASALYSAILPADAEDRGWQPWKQRRMVDYPVCGRHMPGLASVAARDGVLGLLRVPFDVLVAHDFRRILGGQVCAREGLPSLVLRRDGEGTEFFVGPMPATSARLVLDMLTADPSVSVKVASTPIPDLQRPDPTWTDPRTVPITVAETGYIRIRLGRNS